MYTCGQKVRIVTTYLGIDPMFKSVEGVIVEITDEETHKSGIVIPSCVIVEFRHHSGKMSLHCIAPGNLEPVDERREDW